MSTGLLENHPYKAPRDARNGVDTPTFLATINLVGNHPDMAQFRFRARNRWIDGTHNRSTFTDYFGANEDQVRDPGHAVDADHPQVLCGNDKGPAPTEYLLHALAACLTAGIANIAAARGITLYEVESIVEGDIDLRGMLGLDDTIRNGFSGVRATFRIQGDGSPDELASIVEKSKSRSAVFDVLTNGIAVGVQTELD